MISAAGNSLTFITAGHPPIRQRIVALRTAIQAHPDGSSDPCHSARSAGQQDYELISWSGHTSSAELTE